MVLWSVDLISSDKFSNGCQLRVKNIALYKSRPAAALRQSSLVSSASALPHLPRRRVRPAAPAVRNEANEDSG